jgi:adenine deaminase
LLRAFLTLWLLAACATLARAETVVFTNINVVPMDTQRVIPRTTVIVTDGVIASIGTRAKLPAGTPVIDGRGASLIPGLADMHNHVTSRDDLWLLLANGVTTMLNMGEATNSFAGRTRIAVNEGKVLGAAKFGVVAPGYRADLLLVAENPLANPATLRAPLGVMVGGRWHDAAALKAMLAEVAARRVVPQRIIALGGVVTPAFAGMTGSVKAAAAAVRPGRVQVRRYRRRRGGRGFRRAVRAVLRAGRGAPAFRAVIGVRSCRASAWDRGPPLSVSSLAKRPGVRLVPAGAFRGVPPLPSASRLL